MGPIVMRVAVGPVAARRKRPTRCPRLKIGELNRLPGRIDELRLVIHFHHSRDFRGKLQQNLGPRSVNRGDNIKRLAARVLLFLRASIADVKNAGDQCKTQKRNFCNDLFIS